MSVKEDLMAVSHVVEWEGLFSQPVKMGLLGLGFLKNNSQYFIK